jgi:maltoporin
MKIIKQLPLTMAVIAALCPISVLAQETMSQEQIDQIVAKAVDKALADREAKIDAARLKKTDTLVTPEVPTTPDLSIPLGLKFTGYARYGAHFQAGDQKYIGVDGSYNGSSAIGRLGNEGNGGEFQLTKAFKSEAGAIWDVGVMIDHWGDEVNLKKAYAGVTNLFESQPNAYFWAGRDFHQRPQQGINDYFWMNHDGQGAGVKNLDLGFAQLDFAGVGSVEQCDPEMINDGSNPSRISCTGGSGTGDKGNYAATSKLHGIKFGPIDFELYANYGFDSKAIDSDDRSKAWQGAVVLSHAGENSLNKIIARYSDHSDNSVYNKTNGLHTIYTSFEGNYKFTPQMQVEYLLAFHDYDNDQQTQDNRRNYGAIVRPMYFWNNVHSTWLEAGYQRVDYEKDGDNKGWKLTLSQNIAIAMGPEFRPMLRFYVTGGQVENNHTTHVAGEDNTQLDSFNVGAMWEAWW